jgi:hypothetical protein
MLRKLVGLAFLVLLSANAHSSTVSNGCDAWECYAGEGTIESPYLITIAVHLSHGTVTNFNVKEIEALAVKGIADFNVALKNSGIETVKVRFQQLVAISKDDYIFKGLNMRDELVDYANCDNCYKKTNRHGSDLALVFHSYPDDSGLQGITAIGGDYAAINLTGSLNDINKTIVHEIGHMFGAGHHAGIATSGGAFSYSNAVVCDNDEERVSSIVSAWENSSQLLQFSSPGMPCGTSDTDNKRTILEEAQRKGAFREVPSSNGSVRMIVADNDILEGETSQISIVRDGDINSIGYVGLWVVGEAAESKNYVGDDYLYFEFKEGEDTINIDIQTLHNNQWHEKDKNLVLTLDYPTGLHLSEGSNTSIIIVRNIDDLQQGHVSFDAEGLYVVEGEKSTITLLRSEGLDSDITVNIVTVNQSATGDNYIALTETIVFLQGEATKTIEIETVKDNVFTADLTFSVKIEEVGTGNNDILPVIIKNIDSEPVVVAPEKKGGASSYLLFFMIFVIFLRKKEF